MKPSIDNQISKIDDAKTKETAEDVQRRVDQFVNAESDEEKEEDNKTKSVDFWMFAEDKENVWGSIQGEQNHLEEGRVDRCNQAQFHEGGVLCDELWIILDSGGERR